MTHCRVITITQHKGGTGKTTLAAHLSVALALKGKKVALIDTAPEGELQHWYNARLQSLGDKNTIDFLVTSEWQLFQNVDQLRATHDFVIIDTHSKTTTEARSAVRVADLALVPLQPSPADLWATNATIDVINSERIPHRIVINRIVPYSSIYQKVELIFEGLISGRIHNHISLVESMCEGLTACEVKSGSVATRDILELSEEILQLLLPHNTSLEEASYTEDVLEML